MEDLSVHVGGGGVRVRKKKQFSLKKVKLASYWRKTVFFYYTKYWEPKCSPSFVFSW
jgi:hypothetical protein